VSLEVSAESLVRKETIMSGILRLDFAMKRRFSLFHFTGLASVIQPFFIRDGAIRSL